MGDYYTNTSEYSPNQKYIEQPSVTQSHVVEQPSVAQSHVVQQPNVISSTPYLPQNYLSQNYLSQDHLPKQYKYNKDVFNIDFRDILKRAIKYLIEGLAVAFVAYYFIGKGKLDIKDIVMLGITAAFVFAILDTFSPTVALGARFGAGFGIGQGLFGLNPAILGPGVVPTGIVAV